MPGPIFIHFQTYSRKENAAGNSVRQVIAEAIRDSEYSDHVENPKPPRLILGNPTTFEKDHEDHLERRATVVKVKKKTHKRAIRQDRHTLATAVASYPLTHDQIAAGGEDAARHHRTWEAETVKWMRDKYGDQVKVALAHDDESHPHLHFWMLPDDADARADTLHPGKVAKRAAEDLARASGSSDREAVKIGNTALKTAMRETLDNYHRTVGEPLGMTRDGPKRRRLSRKQWNAEKQEAARVADALERAEKAEEIADAAEALRSETNAKRKDFEDTATTWFNKQKASLADQKKQLDDMSNNLGIEISKLEKEKSDVSDLKKYLSGLLDQAQEFLSRPDLPQVARVAGAALMKAAGRSAPDQQTSGSTKMGGLRRRAGIDQPPVSTPETEKTGNDPGPGL